MEELGTERFEEFSQLIGEIQGDMNKIKQKYTTGLGMKPVHVLWLYLLKNHPEGMSASELAEASHTSRSLVSRGIEELFDEEIIWSPDHSERRRYGWKLRLTEKGEQYARVIALVVANIQEGTSGDISKADLAVFYRVLRTLAERFSFLAKDNGIQKLIDRELGR